MKKQKSAFFASFAPFAQFALEFFLPAFYDNLNNFPEVCVSTLTPR